MGPEITEKKIIYYYYFLTTYKIVTAGLPKIDSFCGYLLL